MIKTEKLCKSYEKNEVLKELNLTVNDGEIYGFIGKNGAGKTTALSILAGLLDYNSGKCFINNTEIKPNRHIVYKICGFLPEEPKFYPYMSGLEYLCFLGRIIGHSEKERLVRSKELLETVGLSDAAKRKTGGYSRGMKQRLGIAVAMYHNPPVFLLDEPSSALDPIGRQDMIKILTALKNEGKTVMLSTHILSDIEHLCDRVGIISGGKMALEGKLNKILEDYSSPGFEITLASKPGEEDINSVKALTFVTNVKTDNNVITVDTEATADINGLFYALGGFSVPIINAAIRKANLDEVFAKIAINN